MNASILVVDDEPTMQEALGGFLQAEGYRVATAGSGSEALTRIDENAFDVIVADIRLPGASGLEVLERSRLRNPGARVILMTGHGTVETAVEALRKGAGDYLLKPFLLEDLALCVQRLLRDHPTGRASRPLERPLHAPEVADILVGESIAIRTVREQILRCAPTPSNVLVTGESGTGKELVARAIHVSSRRRDHRFVPLNCGAIPEALLESTLFGHVKGAFTGAVQANTGLFAAADHGTLFLDEIAELPFPLQVKLLRVIEEKQVWAVGATRPLPVRRPHHRQHQPRPRLRDRDWPVPDGPLLPAQRRALLAAPPPRAPERHPAPGGPLHPPAQRQAEPPGSRCRAPGAARPRQPRLERQRA